MNVALVKWRCRKGKKEIFNLFYELNFVTSKYEGRKELIKNCSLPLILFKLSSNAWIGSIQQRHLVKQTLKDKIFLFRSCNIQCEIAWGDISSLYHFSLRAFYRLSYVPASSGSAGTLGCSRQCSSSTSISPLIRTRNTENRKVKSDPKVIRRKRIIRSSNSL